MDAQSRRLRGALLGFGVAASQDHLPAFLERARTRGDAEIVAIADTNEARRMAATIAHPEGRIYTDPDILIEQETGNIDFVVIATPSAFHAPLTATALEAGMHVLCELPLSIDGGEAAELEALVKTKQRVLFPFSPPRHLPVTDAVQDVLESGRLGRVRGVSVTSLMAQHPKGIADWRPDWRREKTMSGGGVACEAGSQILPLIFKWLQSHPTAVTAKTMNLDPKRFETEDGFNAVMTFPDGSADIHLNWSSGAQRHLIAIQGERGAITIVDDEMQVSYLPPEGELDPIEVPPLWQGERRMLPNPWRSGDRGAWFHPLFDAFLRAVREGDYLSRATRDALFCTTLTQTAYLSAQEHSRELPV